MDCVMDEAEEVKQVHDSMQQSVERSNNIEPFKEMNCSVGVEFDSTQSDGTKTSETREERIKRLKEKSEADRQRKYTEILESQKLSNELRLRQQEDRRKKIEELKQREEERKKKVEQRRLEVDAKEKEKNESMLRRTMEREARALILQKQMRTAALMTQSMSVHNQGRMTTSAHSARGVAHPGSDKCTKVYSRSSSGFAVDRVSSYVARLSERASSRPSRAPKGCTEVDGRVVPANVRHAGCFVVCKRPQGTKVKGVLAWGPPPDRTSARGSSVAWWAGIDAHGDHQPSRATSAHASLLGPRGHTHMSTPHNLQKVAFQDHSVVDTHYTNETSVTDSAETLKEPLFVVMTQAKSLHSLGSSPRNIGKESLSPRLKDRSASRPKTDSAASNRVPKRSNPRSQPRRSGDQALYDRLAKPRGESQPPKTRAKEPLDSVHKNMSSSFTKQPSKTPTRTPSATLPTAQKKPAKLARIAREVRDVRKVLPMSAPDSGLTSSPASEMEPAKDGEGPEAVPREEASKTSPRRSTKNPQGRESDLSGLSENSSETKSSPAVKEEDAYRQKLTEQRRLAREAKEKHLEEQRRVEEEARQNAEVERKKMEEETRQMVEEEAKRARQLAEEEQVERDRQRMEEETDRLKKEESERQIEEKRLEKLRLEDSDRMERKRRLEKIMSRVKKTDESSSLSNDESGAAVSEVQEPEPPGDQDKDQMRDTCLEEHGVQQEAPCEPREAWVEDGRGDRKEEGPEENLTMTLSDAASPSLISDDVLNLPGPQTNSSCMSQSQVTSVADSAATSPENVPLFKSRLLQSMIARGRLTNAGSERKGPSPAPHSEPASFSEPVVARTRQGPMLPRTNGDADTSHTRSYDSDISKSIIDCEQSRSGLSYESQIVESHLTNGKHHSDTENELTLSSLNSISEPALLSPEQHLADCVLEALSEVSCSQLAAERPATVPGRVLELS